MSALLSSVLDDVRLADLAANDEAQRAFEQADLARNVNKGPRLAAAHDDHALDMQIQMQGCIGWLPA